MPPHLEKNHVVATSWQDEALARDGVSREVPCSALKGEMVPDSLPAPVFLPGESQGRQILVGCCLRGSTELDILPRGGNHVGFLELRRHSRVTTGISAFPLGWPWEAQSSTRVARVFQRPKWSASRSLDPWALTKHLPGTRLLLGSSHS